MMPLSSAPISPIAAVKPPKKYFIRTYGCQMNEQDSLQAGQILQASGLEETKALDDADIILINTCSVREKPVNKVLSDLGRLKSLKHQNPQLIVGVMGCVAQQEKEQLLKRSRELDLVVGPDHLRDLPQMIDRLEEKRDAVIQTRFLKRDDYRFINLVPSDLTRIAKRAFVNIMKGCDNMCSFCIVPYVRGREVSRPSHEILTEVEMLIARGVEDITLLGQNVNSYGAKTPGELTFTGLLYAIADRAHGTPMDCLRFMTPHPKDVGPELIRAFAEIECLTPHFHLPVQSGSNRILQLMRRAYTRESFLHIVRELRRARPDIAITTDIIVGFPGETADDVADTLSLMDEARFDGIFSFIYSPRPHTSASRLADTTPIAQKKAWLQQIQARQRKYSMAENLRWMGQTIPLLVEKTAETSDDYHQGRSRHNKVVHFNGGACQVGDRVTVAISRVSAAALYGEAR